LDVHRKDLAEIMKDRPGLEAIESTLEKVVDPKQHASITRSDIDTVTEYFAMVEEVALEMFRRKYGDDHKAFRHLEDARKNPNRRTFLLEVLREAARRL
jgi:hypothetical protein